MTSSGVSDHAAVVFQPKTIRAGRGLLFLAGLVIVAWLIHIVRGQRVIAVLHGAGRWMPLVALLELAILGADFLAIRTLLGEARKRVSSLIWFRASALAYATAIFLPLGRAAGEAVRAATLERPVGGALAIRECTRLQACALLGNAAISLVGVAMSFRALAAQKIFCAALLANAVVCAALATSLLLGLKSGRLAQWVVRRFPALSVGWVPSPDQPAARRRTIAATVFCVAGRFVQTAQYGAVLAAVGCGVTPTRAFLAQDIQLVGAAVGDFVPNQMGATESAFFLFGKTLGLADDPSRMVAIALLIRLVQLSLAAACLFLVALVSNPLRDQRPKR